MKNKKKLIILSSIIVGILVVVLGVTYALFAYERIGVTQELVLGDIWMKYTESNGITLENAFPGDDYSKYFEFTITGKNTYEEKDIWYDIRILKAEASEGKTEDNRIEDKYLKFKLVEVNGEVETEIFKDKTYNDLTNRIVHVATIPKSTNSYSKTYRLYMVISEELKIGNTGGTISSEEFRNIFGSIKVATTGDFTEKEVPREPVASETLGEVLKTRTNSYTEDTDGTIYISGKQDDYDASTTDDIDFNYVWYSGKLWRITSINSDGTMKMITENNITSINWGSDAMSYSTSYMREWLNQEFLPTLHNYENIIVTDYKWNATTYYESKPTETTMITDSVGMLNLSEYLKSHGYLGKGYIWWLMSLYNSSEVYYVDYPERDFKLTYSTASPSDRYGVRPAINLKSDVVFGEGDGSYRNPYTIKGDSEEIINNTTRLNTRESGEYVKIENDRDTTRMFRIVGTEKVDRKLTTKLVLNDYLKENDTVVEKKFSNDYTYGDGTTTSYWDYYLNNTYLSTLNTNMLEKGTYYLGTYSGSTSYKSTVCNSIDSTKSMSTCVSEGNVVDTTWTGYVGLLRVGEMFSSQIKDYTWETASTMWLITPYSTPDVWYIDSANEVGNTYIDDPWVADNVGGDSFLSFIEMATRPTINLTSTVVIKSGTGTEFDPFIVGLPS